MKKLGQQIGSIVTTKKFFNWLNLISVTGLSQLTIQILGAVSGIIIIRLLSTPEYALYTIANAMLATMLLLSDGGISAGVISLGGQVWQDKDKLGQVLATGLNLRRKFSLVSLLVSLPILLLLLRYQKTSWLAAGIIMLSVIPSFLLSLSGSLLEIIPKLKQEVKPLQKMQVTASLGRLFLTYLSVLVAPFAFIPIIANSLPQLWYNLKLRKTNKKHVNTEQKQDPLLTKQFIKIVSRILPGTIYYCFSSQITTWIISIFGTTRSIAELGALTRFGVMLTVINALFNILLVPRFARLPVNKKTLLNFFSKIQLFLFLIIITVLAGTYIFSDELLWILGSKYHLLNQELLLTITGSCLGLVSGLTFALCTVRGWVINPFILISISIASIIGVASFTNVSSLQGVLKFQILVAIVQVIIHEVYALIKINQTKNTEQAYVVATIEKA